MNNYIVYLLTNTDPNNNCTYVGITNNSIQRLRKHNGIIKGGAKYTKMKKGNGTWNYYGKIEDLTKSEALSIEKKIHIHSKKTQGKTPLQRRINCINKILETYDNIHFVETETESELQSQSRLQSQPRLQELQV
jgi:predicted GIY-YIG superfamily endonuclease